MNNNSSSRLVTDRLSLAHMWLTGTLLFCLVTMLLLAGWRLWRPADAALTACREFVRRYGVHTTALMPSGHALRHPAGRLPSVDLRFDPRLPVDAPHTGLVFPSLAVGHHDSPQPPQAPAEQPQTGRPQ